MSLLLNLINYSSSLQSQYRLSIPKEDEKDQRAKSLHYVKLNQQNQRAKMSSKSLSKLFPEKPQSNLNPKTRILHRIHHILSLKCKKHYYALFVTLETIKKKNLYLNSQGQFQKLQNRKTQTKISEKENKISRQQEKKMGIIKLFNKIQEIQKIHLIKQFQQHIKLLFFKSLKNHFIYDERLLKLIQKIQTLQQKLKKYQTLKKLKKINNFCFKIEILSTLIDSMTKKYAKKKRELSNSEKLQIFQKIRSISLNMENVKDDIKNPIQENLQRDLSVNLEPIKNEIFLESNQMSEEKTSVLKNTDKKEMEQSNQIFQNQSNNTQQKSTIKNQKLEKSPNQEITFRQIKPLQNLMTRLADQQKRKFQRNELSMIKSVAIKTQFDQKPMIIQKELHNDKTSNFCKKIPKNYIRVCYNDSNQQSNIFSNKQIIGSNTELPLSMTNIFKQSRVTPYRNKKNSKCTDNNINQMIMPLEFKQEQISSLSISNISQVSMLKTQKSTNTLFNDKLLNFSAIGTEAVNFKNSLVHQRQSLKQGDRNFMKKRPNNSQQQTSIVGKSFLRSTLDSKTKNKLQQKLIIDRTYSKDKVSQTSGRLFVLENDLQQISRSREPYWTRPSSPRVQNNRLQNEVQKDHVIFSNNTSFFYQNMTIYPTRDDSSFITAKKSNKTTIENQTQPYLSQKNSKQKSFIKLLSKRQIPFIKQSK